MFHIQIHLPAFWLGIMLRVLVNTDHC